MNEPDDYLWDRTGADPDVERLEKLLAPLGHDPSRHRVPEPPQVPEPANRPWRIVVLTALLAAAAVAALTWRPLVPSPAVDADPVSAVEPGLAVASFDEPDPWLVEVVDGAPSCDGEPRDANFDLEVGRWLETDEVSRARLNVADIGVMDVDPGSRLRLLRSDDTEHRLELAEGRISATVIAPPRFLIVETPVVTAVDMGCAYTLEVADDGGTAIEVTSGWVWLEHPDGISMVPAGARAVTHPGSPPGTPWFTDADPRLPPALASVDAGGEGLATVLEVARPRDTLSLVHVLPRVAEPEREQVWGRLAELAPIDAALRDPALAGDRAALASVLDATMSTW